MRKFSLNTFFLHVLAWLFRFLISYNSAEAAACLYGCFHSWFFDFLGSGEFLTTRGCWSRTDCCHTGFWRRSQLLFSGGVPVHVNIMGITVVEQKKYGKLTHRSRTFAGCDLVTCHTYSGSSRTTMRGCWTWFWGIWTHEERIQSQYNFPIVPRVRILVPWNR